MGVVDETNIPYYLLGISKLTMLTATNWECPV
jgi:hypothetical protein